MDFINSYCFSRKGAGTPLFIYHTNTTLTYKLYFHHFITRYAVPPRTVTKKPWL